MVKSKQALDLSGIRIMMLAPCLGKFGGIETFCLTLIEDLVKERGVREAFAQKSVGVFQR